MMKMKRLLLSARKRDERLRSSLRHHPVRTRPRKKGGQGERGVMRRERGGKNAAGDINLSVMKTPIVNGARDKRSTEGVMSLPVAAMIQQRGESEEKRGINTESDTAATKPW
jgi:hypothetical protein